MVAVVILPDHLQAADPLAGGITQLTARYLVLIVVDGFRPDYMSLAPMHHLHQLMQSGTRYTRAWVGQVETQTPTGHATVVTGVYPKKHGVMGFVWRDATGQNITWMPTDRRLVNAGAMESLIEAGGAPSLSDLIHKKYPGSKTISVSSEKMYAADSMGTGADYIVWGDSYGKDSGRIVPTAIGRHVPPASTHFRSLEVHQAPYPETQDAFAANMSVHLLQSLRPRALLVNLPGADITGHRDGGVVNPDSMRVTVREVDKAIGAIMNAYKKAGLYDKTLFVVTADHGMVPNQHIVPRQALYNAVRGTGALWLEQDFLSTGGYLYLRDPRDTSRVAARLASQPFSGVEGVLSRRETPGGYAFRADPQLVRRVGADVAQAYVDLSDTFAATSGPEIVLPFAEDTMGINPKNLGQHWGSHGGLSWRVQHIPLIVSGPGVRRRTSLFSAQLVDIAPTIERLMGLPIPAAVDGVVLADAVRSTSVQDTAAQLAVSARRSHDVDALRRHSLGQHGIALSGQ